MDSEKGVFDDEVIAPGPLARAQQAIGKIGDSRTIEWLTKYASTDESKVLSAVMERTHNLKTFDPDPLKAGPVPQLSAHDKLTLVNLLMRAPIDLQRTRVGRGLWVLAKGKRGV